MCTVTYLPLKDGFLFTSNRDERLLRKPSTPPQIIETEKCKILFPRDGEAGGTWMATADNHRSVCLLNGAFHPHVPNPPYRMSRGLVVLDFFKTDSAENFNNNYDLSGIEPFTLVIIEHKKLFEFRWDGLHKYFKPLENTVPHIYCSATLYTPEVIAMREQWFDNWLNVHSTYKAEEILAFHLFAGNGDESTNIRMSRWGIVQTVSITCIQQSPNIEHMFYSDLKDVNGQFIFNSFSFNNQVDGIRINKGIAIKNRT